MSWLGESKLSLSTYDNSIPNSFTLFVMFVDCCQEVESLTFQWFIWYTSMPSYSECSLISYQKIQIRGGGECFVKLNHRFNPAEKYGVQQYWFKDCNKGYHGLAAQICSSGHKDSGNWKNANRKLSPSHITLGLPSPLPQACVLNQFIRIYFECLIL